MNLKKKDMKLLFELDSDYRKPYSRIGKRIRMSQQLISYKVKSFLEEGILLGNYPLIDYSRFSYLNFRVYFKVNYMNRERFRELVDKLELHKSITTLTECDGRYDLMAVFATKNPSSFNKMLRELVSDNPKQLKNCVILTTVVEHRFPRSYLGGMSGKDTVIGGDREDIRIDQTDKRILRALLDGKKTVVEIAKTAKLNPKTAMLRLKAMERKEILKGYRIILDTRKIGFSTNKILIKYHNISTERESELRAFCQKQPNITEFIKTFGEWDLELTVETKTREEFRNLYIMIREKFEDIIEDFDNFRVFRIHKKRTLPEEFFI